MLRFLFRLWNGDEIGRQIRLAFDGTRTSGRFRRMLQDPLRNYLEQVLFTEGVCGVRIGIEPVDRLCTSRRFGSYPPEYVVQVVTYLKGEFFEQKSPLHFVALCQAEFSVLRKYERVPIEFHITGETDRETWDQAFGRISPSGTVSLFSLTPSELAA